MNTITIRNPQVAGVPPVTVYPFSSLAEIMAIESVARWSRDADFTGYEMYPGGHLGATYCGRTVADCGVVDDPADPVIAELLRVGR